MKFLYRGSAVGFGGQMTRPVVDAPPAQAATTLPTVGGYASALVQDYVYRYGGAELVSFRAASSQVVGNADPDGRVHSTLVSCRVEGLRVLGDLITADAVVGQLTSHHPMDRSGSLPMLPECSGFWNLRIQGRPLDPKMHPLLLEKATKPEVDKVCRELRFDGQTARAGDPTVFSIFDERSLPRERKVPFRGGLSIGPWDLKEAKIESGWRIDIPGFGKVYLGEYLVFEDHRVLMMMRLELGSPAEGLLALGVVEGNGRPV